MLIGAHIARSALRLLTADIGPKTIATASRPQVDFAGDKETGNVLMNLDDGGKGKITYELTPEMLNAIFDIQKQSMEDSSWQRTKRATKERIQDSTKAAKNRKKIEKTGALFQSTVSFLPHQEKGWVLMIVRQRFEEDEFELYPEIIQDIRNAT